MRDGWARAEVLRIGEQGSGNTVEVATTLWNHVYRDYATDAPAPLDESLIDAVKREIESHARTIGGSSLWIWAGDAEIIADAVIEIVRTALGERAGVESVMRDLDYIERMCGTERADEFHHTLHVVIPDAVETARRTLKVLLATPRQPDGERQ